MIKYLSDSHCIQVERLLMLKGKSMGLSDQEIMILMLIYIFDDLHMDMITPALIKKYCSCSNKDFDQVLQSLLNKRFIENRNGRIQLHHFVESLLQTQEAVEDEQPISLLEEFENQFARALSPMEMDVLKEWKDQGHSDEHILLALKEAVKSQVLNFRYIEGILNNWAKNGVKQRYVESKTPSQPVSVKRYDLWHDE